MNADAEGEPRAVLAATKEQLTNAPAFEERDQQMAANTTANTVPQ